jgi:hypothetical protein
MGRSACWENVLKSERFSVVRSTTWRGQIREFNFSESLLQHVPYCVKPMLLSGDASNILVQLFHGVFKMYMRDDCNKSHICKGREFTASSALTIQLRL